MAATYWKPDSPRLTPAQALMLSVPALLKPAQERYLVLLTAKMALLVLADPITASVVRAQIAGLEKMSDQWLAVDDEPLSDLPEALTNSESMQNLRALIEWRLPGSQIEPPAQTLPEVLSLLD